jgi:tetratricopeptide (TPR) repeat protein
MTSRNSWILAALGVAVVSAGAGWWWFSTAREAGRGSPALAASYFVGHRECVDCHRAEADAWRSSQHAVAMQHARADTVRGDFEEASFESQGVESRFFRRDGRFFVHTDGPDGALADFEIRYTFGVAPLQQYLVEFPDGRLQALTIAWDDRAREDGGQRWFDLYPDERIDHRDELHWTRLNQNWNWMCADCHSTNLVRNYDAATDRFRTTFSDIAVACEACHGPGSRHVAWAKQAPGTADVPHKGLAIALDERHGVSWTIDPATGNATRSRPLESHRETETCAVCHARRASIATRAGPTGRLIDTHDLALLLPPLYELDGQMRDEVFNHGSFLQSRMYAQGVICSDCHEPHTQQLRAPGSAVCAQCHLAGKYATEAHHGHAKRSAGAECVACHMPARTYMVIDRRHDHAMRVPRPDLSLQFGVPNTCNACHTDRDAAWAAATIERRHGPQRRGVQEAWTPAFALAGAGDPLAVEALGALVREAATPHIVRATAAGLLGQFPDPTSLALLEQAASDPDPLVRATAGASLLSFPPDVITDTVDRLANDDVPLVRARAGRLVPRLPAVPSDDSRYPARTRATADFVALQEANAERPESWLNLGTWHAERGDLDAAVDAYRRAIALQAEFVPAWANLADVYRQSGRDAEAVRVLQEGLSVAPGSPALLHALGLARVRERRLDEALPLFRRAAEAEPRNARFIYVYAVALDSAGRRREAQQIVEQGLAAFPNDAALRGVRAELLNSGDTGAGTR